MKYSAVYLAAGLAAVSSVARAEPARISGTVTDIFGPRFVVQTDAGKVLVDIGPKGAEKITIKSGETLQIEGDRTPHELHARRVTMPDGHAYEMGKPGKSWREWLVGKPAEPAGPFGPAEAEKMAVDKGYRVSGEPVPMKKHFQLMAEKDGNRYELDVHRDGKIVEQPAFGIAEAKALAAGKSYQLTSEPVPLKKHFRAEATKNGNPVEIDLHRDGNIVEHTLFGPAEAKKLVMDKGYDPVSDIGAVDEHFELLAKKSGKFFALDAHRDGTVHARLVNASDPRWGSQVQ